MYQLKLEFLVLCHINKQYINRGGICVRVIRVNDEMASKEGFLPEFLRILRVFEMEMTCYTVKQKK